MNAFLDEIRDWAVAVLLAMCFVLGWCVDHYQDKAETTSQQLTDLQARVEQQSRDAAWKLAELTRQRDAKQAELDTFHTTREEHDAATTQEIARLESELATRPVRVRVIAQPAACGGGGGSAAGDAAAAADTGAADGAETHGLLPDANSRRLGAVIAEVETMNAAYASCRARLLFQEGTNP